MGKNSTTNDQNRKSKFARIVGFRFLRAKKSSGFLSLITGISVGGVCVGVLTLVVTLSVMGGFESELKAKLLSAETHVLIQANGDSKMSDRISLSEPWIATLAQDFPALTQVHPVLQTEVIVRAGKKVSGGILKGVGKTQLEWIRSTVAEWAPKEVLGGAGGENSGIASIYMGQELAYDMGVIPGDVLTVVSPVESDGPFGAVPRLKKFVVEGIYRTGVPEQEMQAVFAAQRDVESFLRQEGAVTQIELKTKSVDHAAALALQIRKKLGENYLVRPWQELNAHLFESLRLERLAMFCILLFIVIVASFNIVSTLTMMVIEKKKSLSILRAIGATRKQVGRIFVWEGFAIGLLGVGLGLGLGLGVCWFLDRYPLIELPDYFYDRSLPVKIDAVTLGVIVVVAIGICVVGALLPARKAADLTPIEGVRGG